MNFHLVAPAFLLLLPLALLPLLRARRRATLPFSHTPLLHTARRSWRLRLRPWLPRLHAVGLALLILALARPQWREAQQIQSGAETAVVFALDISNSMMAQDLQPDRLTAAKQLIADVVADNPAVPFGLVLFAERAYVQTPPTRDHAALRNRLDAITFATQAGIPDGTALGTGIATAAGLLADTPAAGRTVVLLTDGTNTDPAIDPQIAAAAAAQFDIAVHTVGIGRPGLAPFPQRGADGPYLVYWESPLDEATLETVAAATNATYTRAPDADSLQQLVTTLDTTAVVQPPIHWQARDLFPWLIGLALLLLLPVVALQQTLLRTVPA